MAFPISPREQELSARPRATEPGLMNGSMPQSLRLVVAASGAVIAAALVVRIRCRRRIENHSETLDYIRAFRQIALVSWASALEPWPHGPLTHAATILRAIELRPSKSLNTRPDGGAWRSGLESVATPASLDDLGAFSLGDPVDAASLLSDGERVVLPYHISAAHRCHVLVAHESGYRPTEASFLFIGQRQRVARVVAVPWAEADRLAESLPEASVLGPVLFGQMVARCGSTVLCHAMERMDVGCQSVSEPDVLGDIHEMLEARLCSRAEAVRALRTAVLLLVHRLRRDRPSAPMVIIMPRSLTGVWRHCELLAEALPEARQILQWRRVDKVVGSLDVAIQRGTPARSTRWLHSCGLDGLLWSLDGGRVSLQRTATPIKSSSKLTLAATPCDRRCARSCSSWLPPWTTPPTVRTAAPPPASTRQPSRRAARSGSRRSTASSRGTWPPCSVREGCGRRR